MSSRTCVLFQGSEPHPAHRQFFEPFNPVYRHFETGRPPDAETNQDTGSELGRVRTGRTLDPSFDLMIAEGTAALQTLVAYQYLSNRDTQTVFLAADETFYTVQNKLTRFLWHGLTPLTNRIDLCVPISDLVTEWIRPFLPDVPCRVVHPTTTPEKFSTLLSVEPISTESPFTLLSVGDARAMKNYSVLVEAVRYLINDRGVDVNLIIVGAGHSEKPYADEPFISTPGQIPVDEFVDYHARASMYVQPSVGDGFGVAALEGMLSGLPTVVTKLVGVKQLLRDEWVTNPTAESLATAIETLAHMNPRERAEIGRSNRSKARSLSPPTQTESFRAAVESTTGVLADSTTEDPNGGV